MTAYTPVYGLPYPTGTDRLDNAVTLIPQALATQIESTMLGWGGIAAPGAWTACPPAANWSATLAGYQAMQYRKVGTQVRVRGASTRSGSVSPAPSTIFTLPAGFRPPAGLIVPVTADNVFARAVMAADGTFNVYAAVTVGGYCAFNFQFDID